MTVTSIPSAVPAATQPTPLVPTAPSGSSSSGFSFSTILDAVNPLQHIPVVSNLYRAATGSQISSVSQVAGDTLYGALLPGGAIAGLASSLVDVGVKQVTGKTVGQIALDAVTPSATAPAAQTATPLIPTSPSSLTNAVSAATQIPAVPAIPLSGHGSHTANNQYLRAQTLDKINSHLLKMTS